MPDLNADIKKAIKDVLNDLQKQKERYIHKVDSVIKEIQEIEGVHKKIHEYDTIVKEVSERTKQLQQVDKDNVKKLDSFEHKLTSIERELDANEPKLRQIKSAVTQQEELTAAFKDISKSIQKLKTEREELVNEYEALSDQWEAMKKSKMYKTLKLLDTDDEAFFEKIADYIVKNVVVKQSGVFGTKDMPLEYKSDK